jgi:hypothetical protein
VSPEGGPGGKVSWGEISKGRLSLLSS